MRLRNEIFATVLDWLVRNKLVTDQKDLAQKMKVSQNTMSRIMTGKVEPKDETLRKLNEAFGYIFNMKYLRGEDPMHMLIEDLVNEREDQMFGRESKQNDALAASLEATNNDLRKQLSNLSDIIQNLTTKNEGMQNRMIELEIEVGMLKGKLEVKDEYIRDLRAQVDDNRIELHRKNEDLKVLKQILDEMQNNPLKNYHFPVGVADDRDIKATTNPLI